MVGPAGDGPPPFDDAFAGDDVEQRIYATILQTREPTTASSIADRADCAHTTAQTYLSWFDILGIVTRHDGRPATYERNDAYFEWRHSTQLAATRSVEALQERVRTLTTRITDYEARYDATAPANVDALAAVAASDERTIDDVYTDLADWATARTERDHYKRARDHCAADETDPG